MQYAFRSSGQRERKAEVQDELDELLKWLRQPETRASKRCLIHEESARHSELVFSNCYSKKGIPSNSGDTLILVGFCVLCKWRFKSQMVLTLRSPHEDGMCVCIMTTF